MKEEMTTAPRYRIFNAIFLVGIFMSFSCAFLNYLLGSKTIGILASFLCGIITIGLYAAFKITKNYSLVSFIVVIFLSFVFFPTMWLITGGTHGSIPYYVIINAGIIALLLTGLKRKVVFLLFALVVGVLMVIEYQNPNMIVAYDSQLIRYFDFAFGLFVCFPW